METLALAPLLLADLVYAPVSTEALVSCELGSLSLATSYGSLESFLKVYGTFPF